MSSTSRCYDYNNNEFKSQVVTFLDILHDPRSMSCLASLQLQCLQGASLVWWRSFQTCESESQNSFSFHHYCFLLLSYVFPGFFIFTREEHRRGRSGSSAPYSQISGQCESLLIIEITPYFSEYRCTPFFLMWSFFVYQSLYGELSSNSKRLLRGLMKSVEDVFY